VPDRAPSAAADSLLRALRDEAVQRSGLVRDLMLSAAEEIERLRAQSWRPAQTFTVRIEADCSQALAELERLKATIAEAAELARAAAPDLRADVHEAALGEGAE
jgi:hypothetical protein